MTYARMEVYICFKCLLLHKRGNIPNISRTHLIRKRGNRTHVSSRHYCRQERKRGGMGGVDLSRIYSRGSAMLMII